MSDTLYKKLIPFFAVAALVGCGGSPHKTGESNALAAETGVAGEANSRDPVADNPAEPLTTEIIYNILVGEIALQRKKLDLAYRHQLQGANLAHDAIAMHQNDQVGALEALNRWLEFAPNDPTARQLGVMLHMQSGRKEQALEHLRALVKIHGELGQNGFLHAVAAAASGKDQTMVLVLMRELASDYPDDPRAGYAVALSAVMTKQLDAAEEELLRLLDRHPDMEKAHVLLSRIHTERGDKDSAKLVLKQALKAAPESRILNSSYARLLVDANEPELAYRQFQKLQKLMPEDADVRFSLGVLALQLERIEVATGHFETLIEMGKRVQDAAFFLGRIEEMESRNQAAIGWYSKVKKGKYSFDAQVRTVRLLADDGELERAQALLQSIRSRMPERSVALYLLEGEILRNNAAPEKVVELYNAALEAHPEEIDLLYARALFSALQGRVDILEQDLRKILQREPNHADALNALGYTLADQTDRYQEALGYITQALKVNPDSPAILDSMGWVLYRLGNKEEALRYLRRAFSLLPDAEIAAHFGEVLWITGQKEEAQKVFQGALEKDPESTYLKRVMDRLGE